jgi:hypothetical protein
MKINWKVVIIGLLILLTLEIIRYTVFGAFGGIIEYLLATIYVGYAVGGDYRNGAVHGALLGIIFVMISEILLIVLIRGLIEEFIVMIVFLTLFRAISFGIIGLIGGIIGTFIKKSKSSQEVAGG